MTDVLTEWLAHRDAADAVPMPMAEAEAVVSRAVEHCERHHCVSIGVDARALRSVLAEVRRLTALTAQHEAAVTEARRATRKECAALCDAVEAVARDCPECGNHGGEKCATAIRALPDAPTKDGGR